MAQRHLDRLSALDASFLTRDGMHTGGVLVLEGAVPSVAEFSDFLAARLSPRFRQKVLDAPGGPRWADDPAFDIGFHVRPAALPSPAGDSELRTFVAQVAGQQLDRKRPLWECWLVECGADHFAVVFKSHLILGALDLLAGTGASDAGSSAHATPSQRELLVRGAVDAVGFGVGLAGRTLDAALHPTGTLREAVGVAAGVGELALASLNPAPASPLNVPIGRHRRYELVRHELDDYVRVKSVFGTTVNDVVLAVLTGGLRQWLLSRAVSLEGLELRALLPVHGLVRAPLPVSLEDPVAGLGVVRDALRSVDDPPADGAPFSVLAEAARLQFSARLFNLSVGSASGPSEPLELLGRQVVDLFGLPFLPAEHGFAASVITYDGRVEYGLLGDYDALGDLGVVAAGIDQTLGELLAAAAAVEAVRETRRRQDSAPPAAEVPELEPIAEGGLMSSTVRRHGGPASDMRAKRRRS